MPDDHDHERDFRPQFPKPESKRELSQWVQDNNRQLAERWLREHEQQDSNTEQRYATPEAQREFDRWVAAQARQQRRRMANESFERIERTQKQAGESEDLLVQALKTIEATAKANSDLAGTVRFLLGQLSLPGFPQATTEPVETERAKPDDPARTKPDKPKQSKPPQRSSIIEWRTYSGFRNYMVGLENRLRPMQRADKVNYGGKRHGDSVRSITRNMRRHNLPDDLFPPSLWPEQEPPRVG